MERPNARYAYYRTRVPSAPGAVMRTCPGPPALADPYGDLSFMRKYCGLKHAATRQANSCHNKWRKAGDSPFEPASFGPPSRMGTTWVKRGGMSQASVTAASSGTARPPPTASSSRVNSKKPLMSRAETNSSGAAHTEGTRACREWSGRSLDEVLLLPPSVQLKAPSYLWHRRFGVDASGRCWDAEEAALAARAALERAAAVDMVFDDAVNHIVQEVD